MENKNKFIPVVCNMLFDTDYSTVEDMPVEQYEFFNNIPYVSLIKPLVQKDKAVKGNDCASVGYEVRYTCTDSF